jgi:hypothetical protein
VNGRALWLRSRPPRPPRSVVLDSNNRRTTTSKSAGLPAWAGTQACTLPIRMCASVGADGSDGYCKRGMMERDSIDGCSAHHGRCGLPPRRLALDTRSPTLLADCTNGRGELLRRCGHTARSGGHSCDHPLLLSGDSPHQQIGTPVCTPGQQECPDVSTACSASGTNHALRPYDHTPQRSTSAARTSPTSLRWLALQRRHCTVPLS